MPKKILIVEDEAVLRKMYAQKFTEEGLVVVAVSTAEEGFAAAKKEMPDLVLLDIILPKKDGIYLLQQIREDPKTANVTVVAFSNYDDPQARKRTKELGVLAYLMKTDYTPTQIVKEIKKFLNQAQKLCKES